MPGAKGDFFCMTQYFFRSWRFFWTPQKWPSLHKRCEMCWIEWKIMYQIFTIFSFWVIGRQRATHAILSLQYIVYFINHFVHNFQLLLVQNRSKMISISKDDNVLIFEFCMPEFIFVRSIVFELWLCWYFSTVVFVFNSGALGKVWKRILRIWR